MEGVARLGVWRVRWIFLSLKTPALELLKHVTTCIQMYTRVNLSKMIDKQRSREWESLYAASNIPHADIGPRPARSGNGPGFEQLLTGVGWSTCDECAKEAERFTLGTMLNSARSRKVAVAHEVHKTH